ncbi:MAG TPA: FG-GAP-like repeat-containing protein [Planctomycetota bacterium]
MPFPRRSSIPVWLAAGALAASAAAQGAAPAPERARDPDRGLAPELRERLARVDPARDDWEVERWAALVEARLAELAQRWARASGGGEPLDLAWVAPELALPALAAPEAQALLARGPWRVTRHGSPGREHAPRPFGTVLGAWRAAFEREAYLLCELQALEREGELLLTRVHLSARGGRAGARLQQEALWTCLWQPREEGLVLVGVAPESLESLELAGRAEGLFVDATERAFGPERVRAELAPGLDEWRRAIPDALEPGTLGHHGLAIGDADGDGREDLYWCRPGGLPNRLFLRTAAGGWTECARAAGVDLLDYSSSALLADLDGDGDQDLVVATGTGLHLFSSAGPARFTPALHVERALPTSLAAADFDRDGDLDLYACAYLSPYERSGTPVPYHRAENGEPNVLLRNDGAWRFADVTAEVGLGANDRRFSLAAAWEDFDDDGDADLYVANDFGANNLYRNDGGRFTDVAAELGVLDVAAGMGVTWGDVDGDGWSDLYVTNLHSPAGMRLTARPGFRGGRASEPLYRHHALGNSLFLNQAGRGFRDVSAESGTARGRWGWGALFLDLDGDGALDLFGPNGFRSGTRREDLDSFFWRQVVLQSPEDAEGDGTSYALGWSAVLRLVRAGWSWNGHERNVAFLNLGSGRFADVSGLTGLDLADDARAAARLDWDGDGDEDLLVTNRTGPMLRLLLNDGPPPPTWVALELRGAGRTPVGARVELETSGGRRLVRALRCGEGYLAQSSARLTFALGGEEPRQVRVRWPDGTRESFEGVGTGATWTLTRGTGRAQAFAPQTTADAPRPEEPAALPDLRGERLVLPAPLPLPRLALESADGRAAALFGITMQGPRGTGRPLLLVTLSLGAASAAELTPLASAARALEEAGLQVLALPVDAPSRPAATARLEELGWPFAHAFASEEALQILELVLAALRQDARTLPHPAGFLVDPDGRLLAAYEGVLDPERVRADLALLDLAAPARRDACVPFPGRWLAPPPETAELERAVATRLEAHGLARAAAEYGVARVEVRSLPRASIEYERGVAHHRAGRLQEAQAHYRKALAADAGHAAAARDLAVALHQARDLDAALEAYQRALELGPDHAQTRCNLGLLFVERGELELAEGELEALRALGSDLAPRLAAAIERRRKP